MFLLLIYQKWRDKSTIKNMMTPTQLKARKKRFRMLDNELKKMYPAATIVLNYGNPWELLVAVILSAQSTDKQVNKITEKLFKKYVTIEDYVAANPKEFEKDIYSSGFYRSKTRHILATAQIIAHTHRGRVPDTMDGLLALPGVARKTANVVLGNAYGRVEGIAVDTHVKRFVQRYDLSDENTPEHIERDLMQIIPRNDWFGFTYRAIEYGREYCPARAHAHEQCPLVRAERAEYRKRNEKVDSVV
jgi:endonuclease III